MNVFPAMRSALPLLMVFLSSLFAELTLAQANLKGFSSLNEERQVEVERQFLAIADKDRFKKHLQELTKEPHLAGTPENKRVSNYIATVMRKAGMRVTISEYDVFLPPGPGTIDIELLSPISLKLNNIEKALDEDSFSQDPRLLPGWNAFSGSGDVAGEIIYANMGRKQDFERLKQLNISVKDKIVIARYGGNFRGFKAKYAQLAGAKGLVIFNDPGARYNPDQAYPNGFDMNGSTVQRGSLLTLDYTGDPLTPFQPALPLDGPVKIDRLNPQAVAFHKIPVTPIPFDSALEILKRMEGPEAPTDWQGGLGLSYKLEGGSGLKLRLKVDQPYKMVRISNVVGTFPGVRFPHEWVLLGSHFDAWGHGAVDPNGGTAMLLSLSENLGELIGKGFRLGRTIKIAHFDAEEYGIIGSAEWVEQFKGDLLRKAVAYINADAAVSGGRFSASSSPTLKSLIVQASQQVRYPGTSHSVFKEWVSRGGGKGEPRIGDLGGGSDHVGFYTFLGIPSAGLSFGGNAPIYHSNYDTFAWYSRFGDVDFKFGPALARVDGILTLRLANADYLPYDVKRYAADLTRHIRHAEERAEALGQTIDLSRLKRSVRILAAISNQVESRLGEIQSWDTRRIQQVNQHLIALERQWLNGKAIPFSNWNRSLYASPDPFSGYASWMLPGLRYQIETQSWQKIEQAESDVLAVIKNLISKKNQLLRLLVDLR